MFERDLNKRVLENLIKCGAFDSLGVYRSRLLRAYEQLIDGIAQSRRRNLEGQYDLFGGGDETRPPELHLENIPEFTKRELMQMEKETTGLYLTGHPMDEYKALARQHKAIPIGTVMSDFAREGGPSTYRDGQTVVLAGVITASKTKTTRNNSLMAYVTVEDDTGSIELLVFSRVLGESGSYLRESVPILVQGRISIRDEKAPQIMCDQIRPLTGGEQTQPIRQNPKKLYLRIPSAQAPIWHKIQLILTMFPGEEWLKAKAEDTGTWSRPLSCQIHPFLVRELQSLLGKENVVVK